MSRIGKKPIAIEKGVTVKLDAGVIKVQGPKGQLEQKVPPQVLVEVVGGEVLVKPVPQFALGARLPGPRAQPDPQYGGGVMRGYERKLEVRGVGYRAEVKGNVVGLQVGFSHQALYTLPKGIQAEVDKTNVITLTGIRKIAIGRAASELRAMRVPEVYKGKGVRYLGEDVRSKVGKAGIK